MDKYFRRLAIKGEEGKYKICRICGNNFKGIKGKLSCSQECRELEYKKISRCAPKCSPENLKIREIFFRNDSRHAQKYCLICLRTVLMPRDYLGGVKISENKTSLSEKQIQNHILGYLKSKQIYAWQCNTHGTFDQKLGRFRKSGAWHIRGVSDILGILPGGKFLAIEVKSKKGRLSVEQKIFLEEISNRGGVAFVARSIEDVEAVLSKYYREAYFAGDLDTTVTKPISGAI